MDYLGMFRKVFYPFLLFFYAVIVPIIHILVDPSTQFKHIFVSSFLSSLMISINIGLLFPGPFSKAMDPLGSWVASKTPAWFNDLHLSQFGNSLMEVASQSGETMELVALLPGKIMEELASWEAQEDFAFNT